MKYIYNLRFDVIMPKNIIKEIEKALDTIRPSLIAHGGDAEIKSFKNGVLNLKIKGACSDCPMSFYTFGTIVEEMLKSKFKEIKKIKYN